MTGMRRLNSVGEDTSIRHSCDTQLHNFFNKSTLFGFRTNQLLLQLNMAAVKQLTNNHNLNHSYSQHMTPASPLTKEHSFLRMSAPERKCEILISTLDDYHENMDHLILPPTETSSQFMECINDYFNDFIDNSRFTASDIYVPVHNNGTVSSKNIYPAVISEIVTALIPDAVLSNNVVTSEGEQLNVSKEAKEEGEQITHCIDNNRLSVSEDTITASNIDPEISESLRSSPLETVNVATGFSGCSLHNSKESMGELLFDSDKDIKNAHLSRTCDTPSSKVQVKPMLKPIIDLTSILSAPRKTVKKGRPSLKKQKKRQREKRNRESPVSLENKFSVPIQVSSVQELKNVSSSSFTVTYDQPGELSDSLKSRVCPKKNKTLHDMKSAQVKVPSELCLKPTFMLRQTSYEADSIDTSNEDWSWSEDSVSPFKVSGFNFALNLDSLFKQKITLSPDIEFDKAEKKNDKHLGISAFSPTCPEFGIGLSLSSLFSSKPRLNSQEIADSPTNAVEIVEDTSLHDRSLASSNFETDAEMLNRVNAKWNENYPAAGTHSCFSSLADEVKVRSIKVHFPAEPDLFTVHVVGTEERGGTWHLFALDRERFERRIQVLEEIISPVLEPGHRAKIMKNRFASEEQKSQEIIRQST